jgi:DNA-binding response OmpR family regulator
MNVLVVSEALQISKLLVKELNAEGFRAAAVFDPDEMWDYFLKLPADLVLLDLTLESCDCWQLLVNIKSDFPDLPVLVYLYNGPESINRLKQTIVAASSEML